MIFSNVVNVKMRSRLKHKCWFLQYLQHAERFFYSLYFFIENSREKNNRNSAHIYRNQMNDITIFPFRKAEAIHLTAKNTKM